MANAPTSDTVLILTDRDDHTSDLIVSALHRRRVPVVRLDPGFGFHMEVTLDRDRMAWRGRIGDDHHTAQLENVVGVLWRWPTPPAGHPAIADPAARAWAAHQDRLALYGVLKTLPVRWLNHPSRFEIANNKPGQLLTAAACGMAIPDTIITTGGRKARAWASGRDILSKPFHAQGVDPDNMVIARRADPATIPDELGAATNFQQVIPGPSIRLTVVGKDLFAVRVNGSDDLDGELDWRPVQDQLTYDQVEVPAGIARSVVKYMRSYGLEYGAFDFIDGPDGWVFLECNPSGMYGFVEIKCGLPITDAIAAHLYDKSRPLLSPLETGTGITAPRP